MQSVMRNMTGHAWSTFPGYGGGTVQRCVVCREPARCVRDRTALIWADDSWICPKCGDEWPDETFGNCQP